MLATRILLLFLFTGLAALGVLADPARGQETGPEKEPKPAAHPQRLRPADSDAPLPEGWPGATEPGKIEVKHYPAYRSAVARAKGASLAADNVLFFTLFNHISKSHIEMTAPVVNTYATPTMIEEPRGTGEMTMEFLYRSTQQGQAGKGVGAVVVKDHPAETFVCLGILGRMDDATLRDAVTKLHAWLDRAEHKQAWVQAGPPRRLGYHGPMTPAAERRWELQIPIRPAGR